MARTAPVPNIPAIPGMCPGIAVLGGGGGSGGSGGNSAGKGSGQQGADGEGGAGDTGADGRDACASGGDGGSCPADHAGGSGAMSQGDPVDVVSGEVFTNAVVDVALPGPLPLSFRRSYRGHALARDVGLGGGWCHSFAWALVRSRQKLVLHRQGGAPVTFSHIEPGVAAAGPGGMLLHREREGYVLDTRDGLSRRFEPDPADPRERDFRLVHVQDRSENRHHLHYDAGLLVSIEDSVGRQLRLARDNRGRITSLDVIADPTQQQTHRFAWFEHDEQGRLCEAIDADGHATRFWYDADGRLLRQQLPFGLSYYYRYDAAGRCIETWGAYPDGHDRCLAANLPKTLSDGNTRVRGIHHFRFSYDDAGYCEVIGPSTSHRYQGNDHGKVDQAVLAGSVYSRSYDDRGHLTAYTDPNGAVTEWDRDILGHVLRELDALGNETRYERDVHGDLLRVVDADGGVTEVSYEPQLTRWTEPGGATFEQRRDSRGQIVELCAPEGSDITLSRDSHGNVVEKRLRGRRLLACQYDALGRMTALSKPGGAATRFDYTKMGWLRTVTTADGSVSYERDSLGHVVRLIDTRGQETRWVRGGSGLVADVTLPGGATTKLRYDHAERLVEVHNAAGDVYRIEYDALGMRRREEMFDGRVRENCHDPAGRLVRYRFNEGEGWVDIERDLLGRAIKYSYADGSEETFDYDAMGRLVAANNQHAEVRFAYNAAGLITQTSQRVGDKSLVVDLEYDVLGRVTRRRSSWGHEAEYRYVVQASDPGRSVIETTILLDSRSRVVQQHVDARQLHQTLPAGGRLHVTFDDDGRTRARRLSNAAGQVTADQRFDYAHDELASVWDSAFGTTAYEYDGCRQLVSVASEQGPAEQFRYDACGNLAEAGDGAPWRVYERGRLLRRGDTQFEWDGEGRMTAQLVPNTDGGADRTEYKWSAAGRLSSVLLPDGRRVEFSYDALGRRVRKLIYAPDVGGVALQLVSQTDYGFNGSQLLHECERPRGGQERMRSFVVDGDGNPWAQSSWHAAAEAADQWHFILCRDNGMPDRIVDGSGEVVTAVRASAWGQVDAAAAATPFRFTGQLCDEETGLCCSRYRYYAPWLGLFLSPDPLLLAGDLQPWRYARNNPISYIDPDGLVYSQIVNKDTGEVLYDGYNPSEGADKRPGTKPGSPRTPASNISDKPCAEANVLSQMSDHIRAEVMAEQKSTPVGKRLSDAEVDAEVNSRIKKKFKDENLELHTYHDDTMAERAAACPRCQQMLGPEGLDIADHVVGPTGEAGVLGKWTGKSKKGGKGGKKGGKKGGRR